MKIERTAAKANKTYLPDRESYEHVVAIDEVQYSGIGGDALFDWYEMLYLIDIMYLIRMHVVKPLT